MRITSAVVKRALSVPRRLGGATPLVRTALAFSFILATFTPAALATDYTVTKTADANDGLCSADCSLREAIAAANLNAGADRVVLGTGQTYPLALGRLTVTDALILDGHGSAIDGAGTDRVFDVLGQFAVTINSLTIRGGLANGFLSLGGGLNIRGATVVLNSSIVTGNSTALESNARDDGGGIAVVGSYNAATATTTLASLTLNNSTVSNNTGANGGGIVCVLCSLAISNSSIAGNTAIGGDGAGVMVVGNSSTVSMTSSAMVNNAVSGGAGRGGGLSVPFGSSATTLSRDRIVSNTGIIGSAIFNNLGTITAVNNWWGCNFGPGTGGGGCSATPNAVAGIVATAPYLVLNASASPATVTPGGSSTMTADLTFNSSNVDTSPGGTVPDGTLAAFSGTLGSFVAPSSLTVSGKATDVYTSGGTHGTASLSVLIDGQTVSTTLPVAGCQTITLSATTFANGRTGTAYPATTLTQAGAFGNTTFAVTGGALPGGLSLSSAGTLSGTPTQAGTFNFTVTATDGNGCTGSRAYPLTIVSGTQLTISNIANTSTRRNTPVTVSFVVENIGSGTVSAGSSNTILVPNANLAVGGSGVNRTLTITPTPNQIGTTTIVVNASAGSMAASTSFVLLVYAGTPGDFDGEGKADLTVFRPSNGTWYVLQSGTNYTTATGVQWGNSLDRPVPGDFDGDGRTDIAVFRPSNGVWYLVYSGTGATVGVQWGNGSDVPVPGDYDGDGRTDIAVFRPSNGTWYILESGTGTTVGVQWGNGSDVTAASDYDGDGKTDIAVFRPSDGVWYIRNSATGTTGGVQWGSGSDVPVSGDYDGDGSADIAVFRLSNGTWYLRNSATGTTTGVQWGNGSDVPVPGDYDGDGSTDIAVFRPFNGTWYLRYSGGGTAGVAWGNSFDVPILRRP
jgi:CSLREA domain-containing protein